MTTHNPAGIVLIRQLVGVSQSEVRRRGGPTQGYLSALESGDAKAPSLEVLQRLADALEVPVACLLADPTPEQLGEALEKLGKKSGLPRCTSPSGAVESAATR